MKTRNDELIEAIKINNVEAAKIALENGADPTEDYKILSSATSVEMFNLLLDHGALIRDLSYLVQTEEFDMITNALNHPLCPFSQSEIFSELVSLIPYIRSYDHIGNFTWKSQPGKVLLALIRASDQLTHTEVNARQYIKTHNGPLRIDPNNNNYFRGSITPFYMATLWNQDVCKTMLDNNIKLWNEARLNQYDRGSSNNSFEQSEKIEIRKLCAQSRLRELFQGIVILQLLNLAQSQQQDSQFKHFPKEIIELIIKSLIKNMPNNIIELYANYIKRNKFSLSQYQQYMSEFLFLYSLVEKHICGFHTFTDYKSEQPNAFYSKVNKQSVKDKEGLTAFIKTTLKTHQGNISEKNHELVGTLFNKCIEKKSFYNKCFSYDADIKTDIKNTLAMKPYG